jgi:hypothetical protein
MRVEVSSGVTLATVRVRYLDKRTGSGSPSTTRPWPAWWCVRPTGNNPGIWPLACGNAALVHVIACRHPPNPLRARAVVSGHTDGEPTVGAHCMTTRRIGGADRTSTSEITEISPPTSWAIRGIDGPIRAVMQVSVEPRRNTGLVCVSSIVVRCGLAFAGRVLGHAPAGALMKVPPNDPSGAAGRCARARTHPAR